MLKKFSSPGSGRANSHPNELEEFTRGECHPPTQSPERPGSRFVRDRDGTEVVAFAYGDRIRVVRTDLVGIAPRISIGRSSPRATNVRNRRIYCPIFEQSRATSVLPVIAPTMPFLPASRYVIPPKLPPPPRSRYFRSNECIAGASIFLSDYPSWPFLGWHEFINTRGRKNKTKVLRKFHF